MCLAYKILTIPKTNHRVSLYMSNTHSNWSTTSCRSRRVAHPREWLFSVVLHLSIGLTVSSNALPTSSCRSNMRPDCLHDFSHKRMCGASYKNFWLMCLLSFQSYKSRCSKTFRGVWPLFVEHWAPRSAHDYVRKLSIAAVIRDHWPTTEVSPRTWFHPLAATISAACVGHLLPLDALSTSSQRTNCFLRSPSK